MNGEVDGLQVLMDALVEAGWHWEGSDTKGWTVWKMKDFDNDYSATDPDLAVAAVKAMKGEAGD